MRNSTINLIQNIVTIGQQKGLGSLTTEDKFFDGKNVTINGENLLNFGSCSYLGLEVDQRLKSAAIDSIVRYGVQFSSSRAYLSCPLYKEYEELVSKIFEAPVVFSTSVSLGHHAVIPVVVGENDVIIMDQQVHASVQDAALKMKAHGTETFFVRHNDLYELERKISDLSGSYEKIWYMIDGVYSMYGDFAPIKRIEGLLNTYEKLHLYADDAHGMGWRGKNGRGYILSEIDLHSKMILATSLNKSFAAGGGVFVFPSSEQRDIVKNCGGSFMFSGPHQIPVLGAGIASAKIHLSEEIYERQNALKERIKYCQDLLISHKLPVVSNSETPIFFIGVGQINVGYNLAKRILDSGQYVNLSVFPAVSANCTGLRFTITLHHSLEDIEKLVQSIAHHFPLALKEEGASFSSIYRAFRKVANFKEDLIEETYAEKNTGQFTVQQERSIRNICPVLWNKLVAKEEMFKWQNLLMLEKSFSQNDEPENNWDFHYYVVKDKADQPVLATFFTTGIFKDDMLASANVSYNIQRNRTRDKYYLTSLAYIMGSLVSEGQNLYIDRSRSDWQSGLQFLLKVVSEEQDKQNATRLILKDFKADDKALAEFFRKQGLMEVALPDSHIVDIEGSDLTGLKNKPGSDIYKKVIANEKFYEVNVVQKPSCSQVDQYYDLYLNAAAKSHELSGFPYPKKLFKQMAKNSSWEFIELRLKDEYFEAGDGAPVGVAINFISNDTYYFLLAGLNYSAMHKYQIYPQILWQVLLRASDLKLKQVSFGMTASNTKTKFGASIVSKVAFVQLKDNLNKQWKELFADKVISSGKKI